MKRPAGPLALLPPRLVAFTLTMPVPGGAVAVIEVPELTVKLGALLPPNCTELTLPRFVPWIATCAPP